MNLIDAVQEGNRAAVSKLLASNKAKVNELIKGRSLLSWASQLGHFEVVFELLRLGAKPNLKDVTGVTDGTPLHEAIFGGLIPHSDIVKVLIEFGANPNILDDEKRSPLDLLAIQLAYGLWCDEAEKTKAILLASGAKLDTVPRVCAFSTADALGQLIEIGADPEETIDPVWITGLHLAGARGDRQILKVLIRFIKDINPYDWEHRTPLDLTLDNETRDFLISYGAKSFDDLWD